MSEPHSSPTDLVGVGIDVTDVQRFVRLLERDADRVWGHWFTPAETAQCRASDRPALAAATRFALKEATYKSLGAEFAHEVRWGDIEAREVNAPTHRWQIGVAGEMAYAAAVRGADTFHASTSHDGTRVTATVWAQRATGESTDENHEESHETA